ncbi:putative zinc-binding protein [Methanosphaera sp.]
MTKEITLVACSGLNPRGLVSRAVVSDLVDECDNCNFSCIVAMGGGNKKHISRARDNTLIAVNGCDKNCPAIMLEKDEVHVDEVVVIPEVLEDTPFFPKDSVRINDEEEECIKIIKEEVKKLMKKYE